MSHKRAVLYQARQGWVARLRLRPVGLLRSSAAISKDLALGVAAGVSGVRRLVNEGARAILVMCATQEHAPGGRPREMTGGKLRNQFAKALGPTIPLLIFARGDEVGDEVIE